ncbi:MAG: hypothetical protein V3T39_08840 [Gammaproteobacteria bacterium]
MMQSVKEEIQEITHVVETLHKWRLGKRTEVFEHFVQHSAKGNREGYATGFGLSIVKQPCTSRVTRFQSLI